MRPGVGWEVKGQGGGAGEMAAEDWELVGNTYIHGGSLQLQAPNNLHTTSAVYKHVRRPKH